MASKVFLDANVILEFFLRREMLDDARNIFIQIQEGNVRGFTTASVIQTCGYILIRSFGNETTKKILLGMLTYVTVIGCRHETVISALNSIISDPEDAIQYYSAVENNLDFYITFDKGLIRQSKPNLPILTPKDFLNS
ncbi:PIN domain-containing protein [Daejeonella sp.]|uniref:type II toxin-antitoxin system VapC family toxin n=1 Tax=Daejeonella sp. TaxID=2805397 RepID=UPI0030C067A8